MAKFAIDLNYFDIETKSLIGDMGFYFQTTLDENLWCDSANEMQKNFENGFNGGFIGEEIENPEIHCVCEVIDEFGMIDDPLISNIVLLQDQRDLENEIKELVSQRYPNTEIKMWYK